MSKSVEFKSSTEDQWKQVGNNVKAGIISSFSAALPIQWLLCFKTRDQLLKEGPLTFQKVHKGFFGFTSSFVPTVTTQKVADHHFSQFLPTWVSSACAGVISGFVETPALKIWVVQQEEMLSYQQAVYKIFRSQGVKGFYRGFFELATRELFFAMACLWATPMLKRKMKELGMNDKLSSLVAGVSSGIMSTLFTQALDTRATLKLADPHYKEAIYKIFLSKEDFLRAHKGL